MFRTTRQIEAALQRMKMARRQSVLEGAVDLSKRRDWFVDSSITAANVSRTAGNQPILGIAGATITAGQMVYLDTATNTYKLAKADAAATSVVAGQCLDGGVSGRNIYINGPGVIGNPGFTSTAGTIYVLAADTAGAIAPWADLGTGNYTNVLFIGTATVVEWICKLGSVVHA